VVIAPPDWDGSPLSEAYVEPGTMVNSGRFDGLSNEEGKKAISEYVEEQGWGKRTVTYRLRDYLISRQRYWGTPIPMIHCPNDGIVPVPEADLPVAKTPSSSQPANRRWRGTKGSPPWPARSAAGQPGARPTPWTRSWTATGTSSVT
jgi:leucyl-tRNA synthetase